MTRLHQSVRDAFWCPPDIAELLLFYKSIEDGVAAFNQQQALAEQQARNQLR